MNYLSYLIYNLKHQDATIRSFFILYFSRLSNVNKYPSRKHAINKVDVYNKHEIADGFNDFVTNIGQKPASQIPKSFKTFETYINKVNVVMDSKLLSINELKDVFFTLKINKA